MLFSKIGQNKRFLFQCEKMKRAKKGCAGWMNAQVIKRTLASFFFLFQFRLFPTFLVSVSPLFLQVLFFLYDSLYVSISVSSFTTSHYNFSFTFVYIQCFFVFIKAISFLDMPSSVVIFDTMFYFLYSPMSVHVHNVHPVKIAPLNAQR